MKLTGAEAVIKSLELEGVETIFGYPGGQVLALYDALYGNQCIRHILARHEQGAVHAADGYARATGKVGVVLVTSGPGATNAVTGIATAYMDSIPLVIITGQVPRGVIGTDSFQESDTFGITMPIVKHSYLVKRAADLPTIFHEAFYIARSGRPGPVLIDIPSDVADEIIEFVRPESIDVLGYKPTVKGNARQIKAAVSLLKECKRPVLYVGGGAVSSGATPEIRRMVKDFRIPVVHTLMGIGVLPTNDDLNIGMVGMHGSKAARQVIHDADVIIACGARFSDRVIGDGSTFAPLAKVIHIDIDPAEIGKIRSVDVPIVGDLKGVLSDIIDALLAEEDKPDHFRWSCRAWQVMHEYQYSLYKQATEHHDYLTPQATLALLQRYLNEQSSIVTTEVGQHQMWAAQYIHRQEPRTFLTSGGLGTMGFGFPAALGAQLVCPEAQVVCIAGDGSFVMNSQEMATAAVYNIPVKVLVFNNRCLGMVHQWQRILHDGRYAETELDNCPDFIKLADAYGWQAARAESPADLETAMEAMFAHSGPFLLEVVIPREMEVSPFFYHGDEVSE